MSDVMIPKVEVGNQTSINQSAAFSEEVNQVVLHYLSETPMSTYEIRICLRKLLKSLS